MKVQSLGWEDPLEESMATHSNVLTWRIPWTEEPGGLRSIGSQRVGHDESDLACVHSFTRYLYDCISQIDMVRFLYSKFYKGKRGQLDMVRFLYSSFYKGKRGQLDMVRFLLVLKCSAESTIHVTKYSTRFSLFLYKSCFV